MSKTERHRRVVASGSLGTKARLTQRAILDAARAEFAEKGFAGTRTDVIANIANVNNQAAFYHFGDKEQLYGAVIEDCYSELYSWIGERLNELEKLSLPPKLELKALVEIYFDSMVKFPHILEIVADENKFKGTHLKKNVNVRQSSGQFLSALTKTLKRGRQAGIFKPALNPEQVWISVVSICQFWWDHRYTLSHVLGKAITSNNFVSARRKHVVDFVLSAVTIG